VVKEEGRDLGARAQGRKARITAAVAWPVLRGGRKEGGRRGADRWGWAVREKETGRGRSWAERAGLGAVVRGKNSPWEGKKEKSWATCGRGKGGPRGGLGHWVGLLLYSPFLFLFQ
jgi:hypothetical protein